MTHELELLEVTDSRWAHLVSNGSVYLRPEFAALEAAWMSGTARGIHVAGPHSEVLIPVVERPTPGGGVDWVSPYGYPWMGPSFSSEPGELLSSVQSFARQSGAVSLFLRSDPIIEGELLVNSPQESAISDSIVLRRVNETYSIDLGVDDLLDGYSKGIRRDVRRALREPLDVGVLAEWGAQAEEVLSLYHQSLDRLGASPYHYFDDAYIASLVDAAGEDQFLVSVRDEDGELVCFGLFFSSKPHSQYHISAGSLEHELRGWASKLMIHSAAEELKARGAELLHLGGAPAGNAGLSDLKRRFSSNTHSYFVAEIVCDQRAYDEESRNADNSHSSHFPRYRGS